MMLAQIMSTCVLLNKRDRNQNKTTSVLNIDMRIINLAAKGLCSRIGYKHQSSAPCFLSQIVTFVRHNRNGSSETTAFDSGPATSDNYGKKSQDRSYFLGSAAG